MTDNHRSVDGDVPRVYDKIYILFELEGSGNAYWWPTTVLQSVETTKSTVVKGSGKVEYAARHNMKKEQGDVIFLANRVVSTHLGDTPWRTATEHADAGDGDAGDRDWDNGAEKSKKRRSDGDANQATDGAVHGPNGDRQVIKSRRKGTPRRRIAPAKKVQGERRPTQRRVLQKKGAWKSALECDSRAQHQHSADEARSPSGDRRTDDKERGDDVSLEGPLETMARTRELVNKLTDEVTELRSTVRINVEAERQYELNNKVDEKVAIWKANLQVELARAVRDSRSSDNMTIASVLHRGTSNIKDVMSYETFTQVVRRMLRQVDDTPKFGYTFLPSLEELRNPRMDIGEAHILFHSARAMFRFLGMGSRIDVRSAVAKSQMVRGVRHLRVLGGMQWGGKEEDPIRMFIGCSCVRQVHGEEDKDTVLADAVVFQVQGGTTATTQWPNSPSWQRQLSVGSMANAVTMNRKMRCSPCHGAGGKELKVEPSRRTPVVRHTIALGTSLSHSPT